MKANSPFNMSRLQLHCGHVRECLCLGKHIVTSLEVTGHDIRNLLLNDFEKNVYMYVPERERE